MIQLSFLDDAAVREYAGMLHAWFRDPHSTFWELQHATEDHVRDTYLAIAADPHHDAWLGWVDDEPTFLVESYDPLHYEFARQLAPRPGDRGMHLFVSPPPPDEQQHGFTGRVLAHAVAFCLAHGGVRRVVVDPDVRNRAVHALNARAGFVVHDTVRLPEKSVLLSSVTGKQFAESPLGRQHPIHPESTPTHLDPDTMELAQRNLIAKAIAEFAHERLLDPRPVDDLWSVTAEGSAGSATIYTFRADRYPLEHWVIDPTSLQRTVDGSGEPLDAQLFICEFREHLAIPDRMIGTYLEEIAATLAGAAWKLAEHGAADGHGWRPMTARDLLDADLDVIESAMTAGHPGFVANNGRLGFGLSDHERYAPEAGRDVRLLWLAVRRDASEFEGAADTGTEREFYARELGTHRLSAFENALTALHLDSAEYRYIPVHPWQWENKHQITFAPDIASRRVVPVGWGDRYRAQQSIRTFLNMDDPSRCYIKTALSVQNMGFTRGLSTAYMASAPPINDWVRDLVMGDAELRESNFGILREVAGVGYTGDAYHRAVAPGGYAIAQQKMLAALWREPALPRLEPGERAMTLAAVLHRDAQGASFVASMIEASRCDAREWVSHLLATYLRPLVHCLTVHRLVFMPHGENVILIVRDHVPTRILVKDIGEEIAVFGTRDLPSAVERVRVDVSPEEAALAVFTDVYDGVLRHLAAILDSDGLLSTDAFWSLVWGVVDEHRQDFPESHEWIDLFATNFAHSCLNRLQLRDNAQMVQLSDQLSSLIFAGTLANPASDSQQATP